VFVFSTSQPPETDSGQSYRPQLDMCSDAGGVNILEDRITNTDGREIRTSIEGSQLNFSEPPNERLDIEEGIQLVEIRPREEPPQPPTDPVPNHNLSNISARSQCGDVFLLSISGVAIFLAPVNIVAGMTASQGDNWKMAFVG